ncbi:hypothetical protein COU36_01685 [Candidatus Micrarchaeota archaeon CG10_big_fil_rev_8_21_14_0_10_59_7]|nr:MAG: hypothetical protein COU36_01685 [Candidatus Micrarchaeota archaeon CG10_big_fil_rev_8_21_14_0_10_59_7]
MGIIHSKKTYQEARKELERSTKPNIDNFMQIYGNLFEGMEHRPLFAKVCASYCVNHGVVPTKVGVELFAKKAPEAVRDITRNMKLKRQKIPPKEMHDTMVRYLGDMLEKEEKNLQACLKSELAK